MQSQFLLIFHLITSAYLLANRLLTASNSVSSHFLITLIYMTLVVAAELLCRSSLKLLIRLAACGLIVGTGAWFLLPALPFQLGSIRKDHGTPPLLYLLLLLPLALTSGQNYAIYLFFSVFVIVMQIIEERQHRRFQGLEQELYKVVKENNSLRTRLRQQTQQANEAEHLHRLEERNSISQKIHDQIGHTISGSIYQLDAVQLLMGDDTEKAEQMIRTCSTSLREGLADLRQGVRLIKPGLWDLRLQQIREVLARFEVENMIDVRVDIPEISHQLRRLPFEVVQANLQEGLTNILKHSQAGRVEFSISVFNKILRVRLTDDGRGCSQLHSGVGLQGMEERTSAVGGQLIVDGSKGFSITMIFHGEQE